MGARLLLEWLLSPLVDRAAIAARLEAVAELLDDHGRRGDIRSLLAEAFDLQTTNGPSEYWTRFPRSGQR
jgi:DNA mismatch repair protein MutS